MIFRTTLDEAECAPYPAVSTAAGMSSAGENDQKKRVCIEATPAMHNFDDTAQRALTRRQRRREGPGPFATPSATQ